MVQKIINHISEYLFGTESALFYKNASNFFREFALDNTMDQEKLEERLATIVLFRDTDNVLRYSLNIIETITLITQIDNNEMLYGALAVSESLRIIWSRVSKNVKDRLAEEMEYEKNEARICCSKLPYEPYELPNAGLDFFSYI